MKSDHGYALAFDIGTTKVKASLVDLWSIEIINKASYPAKILYPEEGWAEINPEEFWEDLVRLSREVVENQPDLVSDIKAIVFSPHMAGVVPIDKEGNPLRNIMIWLDERAAGYPKSLWKGVLKIEGYNLIKLLKFLRITGGAPSKTGKDPISKILWIKENETDIYNKTYKFLDVKGYLINKTTGNFVTSPDEANLTWLVDTRKGKAVWHDGLAREYGINKELLPEIKETIDVAGYLKNEIAEELGVPSGIPVLVGAGDLTTAAVGSGAVKEGEVHIYIGTSDWIGAHISKRKVDVSHYIGSIMSAIPQKYLLVAEQEIAGAALDWVMDITNLTNYEELDEKIWEIMYSEERPIIFLPWMYGERCPIDDPYVRGSILNLDVKSDKIDLAKSAMEGVVLNIKWAYGFFEKINGEREEVVAVGGGCRMDSWCQMIADAINKRVKRVKEPENTGLRGAGMIASVGLKIHKSFEEVSEWVKTDKVFEPKDKGVIRYKWLLREFEKLYKKLKKVYRVLNRA